MGKNLGEDPSLEEVIRIAMEARLADLHVSLPAKVVKYDKAKQTVNVEPQIKRKFAFSGEVVTLPVINNVPVAFPRAGTARIIMPIKPGDVVQLVFSERSLDKWKAATGAVDPEDPRKHDLSDAWAVPGGYPPTKAVDVQDDEAILMVNEDGNVMVQGMKVLIGNFDGDPDEPLLLGNVVKQLFSDILQEMADLRMQNSIMATTLAAQATTLAAHNHPVPGITPGPSSTTSGPPSTAGAHAADAATFAQDSVDYATKQANVEALKASPVEDEEILSEVAFTEK